MTDVQPEIRLFVLRDVVKNFGNVVAIQGVTLEVGRGEVVGLIGDNGAGKSTLVKVMNGYYAPDGGAHLFQKCAGSLRISERRAQYWHRNGVPGSRAHSGA